MLLLHEQLHKGGRVGIQRKKPSMGKEWIFSDFMTHSENLTVFKQNDQYYVTIMKITYIHQH